MNDQHLFLVHKTQQKLKGSLNLRVNKLMDTSVEMQNNYDVNGKYIRRACTVIDDYKILRHTPYHFMASKSSIHFDFPYINAFYVTLCIFIHTTSSPCLSLC